MRRRAWWVFWAALLLAAFLLGTAAGWLQPGAAGPRRTRRWLPPREWGFGTSVVTTWHTRSLYRSVQTDQTRDEVRKYGVFEVRTEGEPRTVAFGDPRGP